ncbi:MAG TPA: hypothetical protein VKT70_04890, partial [Stellaceae bacterium]|nr:hypothetical protein [Stellaceae bacterium]
FALTNRVGSRAVGAPALAEAVSLLDFAHRPETETCPQSVCTVRDLALCYAAIDGPGYAQERIAVCTETLPRVPLDWPCFACLSEHRVRALMDAEKVEEARTFFDQQCARLEAEGEVLPFKMLKAEFDLFLKSGKLDEVPPRLVAAAEAEDPVFGAHSIDLAIFKARILGFLGRAKEAYDLLPAFDQVVRTPAYYLAWTDAVENLIKANALPADAPWSATLRAMAATLTNQGAHGFAYEIWMIAVANALRRDRAAVAAIDLESASAAARSLRRPERAEAPLADLRRHIAEVRGRAAIELTPTPEALLDSLGEEQDHERALERLVAARQHWPAHGGLVLEEARRLFRLELRAAAIARLLPLQAKEPRNRQVIELLAELYLAERREEDLIGLMQSARAFEPALAHWMTARLDYAMNRDAQCLEHLAELLKLDPQSIDARKLWVDAARYLGDFRGMKERLTELIALEPDAETYHWSRMVAATIEGDWDEVRQSASALGMTLPGTGPIDHEDGRIRIRFRDEDGQFYIREAIRNGPVTGRITEIARGPNHFRDVVVFDPRPLDRREDNEPLHLFLYVRTLSYGNYRLFAVEGMHPGEREWAALVAGLAALGGTVQPLSSSDLRLRDPQTNLSHPAIFAALAVPEGASVIEAHRYLQECAAKLNLPLIWPVLAKEAGDEAESRRQAPLLDGWERYRADAP